MRTYFIVSSILQSAISSDTRGRGAWRDTARRGFSTLPFVVVMLLSLGVRTRDFVDETAQRFHRTVPKQAAVARFGYTTFDECTPSEAGATDGDMIQDLDALLNAAGAGPGAEVFDFTNSPLLFHYLLDRRPATRYFHVSMAIRSQDQRDLVEELRLDPPPVIVYSSLYAGQPGWDRIGSEERHYEVANWILDHYEPYANTHQDTDSGCRRGARRNCLIRVRLGSRAR